MKELLLVVLAAGLLFQAQAADATWLTDLPAAQAHAKAENKLVLMDFTGSDWCPGCIELKKKVFDTGKFQAYAAKKLVLVLVDFPDKKPLSAAVKKANDDLAKKFDVNGFPTQIVLNANGKEIARLSGDDDKSLQAYSGPKEYISWLEKSAANK